MGTEVRSGPVSECETDPLQRLEKTTRQVEGLVVSKTDGSLGYFFQQSLLSCLGIGGEKSIWFYIAIG